MTEQEEQELRKQVESGREAKIAQKFFDDFFLEERARVISALEYEEVETYESLLAKKIYLRI